MAFVCPVLIMPKVEGCMLISNNAFSTPESLPKPMIVQEQFQSGNMDHVSISSFF